jgi:uncharacterized protein
MLRCLSPVDFRHMHWKNGGGLTREVAVWPPDARLDSFAWRVSIADIEVGGPFSAFPQCDRVIVQLAGEPMGLTHEGGGETPLSLLVPHAFSGDDATTCRLAGPARDFNVITRRDRARAYVSVERLAANAVLQARSTDGEVQLAYVVDGGIVARAGSDAVQVLADAAVVASREDALELRGEASSSAVVFVRLSIAPDR